ncbi:bifunctional lysylphosphatidylglycerol flippase/synthetase MprF [Bacillus songklensis]|uniref:Phosphatidylglycerol lysyltransferase n=1 Tax=Bacillus songklensis TaxID=1069116 RepID=A0ABV8B8V5_9BACI
MSVAKIAFPILLITFLFLESKSAFKDFNFGELQQHIRQLSTFELLAVIAVGLIGVFPMHFYDVVMVQILKINISRVKLLKYSWTFNTYSNLVGFGGVAGAALRTYFYKNYYPHKGQLVKTMAKVSLYYLMGLSLFSWPIAAGMLDTRLLKEVKWLYFAVWGMALYFPVMMAVFKIRKESSILPRQSLYLILTSIGEWGFVIFTIWGISLITNIPITFSELAPIVITAMCAGIVSMIPGGLGSFDLIVLMGFGLHGIPTEQTVLMLFLYRLSYYIVPFVIGTLFVVQYGWEEMNQKWNRLPKTIVKHVSHWVLTILVLLSGVVLLLSAAVPGILERLRYVQHILSFPIMNLSHQLSVAAGIMLISLSRGIEYKVKRIYYITIAVLVLAAVFSLSKGFDYEEAIFLLFVLCVLWLSKDRFYRENFAVTWGKALVDATVIFFFVGLYVVIGYMNLPSVNLKFGSYLQPYAIREYNDLFQSAWIGLLIAILAMVLGFVIRKPPSLPLQKTAHQEEALLDHLHQYGGTTLSHLLFLHDKEVFWAQGGRVLFALQKFADKLIVLGNPTGDPTSIRSALEEIQEEADKYGLSPVYYQVDKEMLPYLHENGYGFFKLGEEAFVDLQQFSLNGKKMKGLRAINNKFKREQYSFEVLSPPFSDDCFQQLKEVSDRWLGTRKEKGFSLGFFNPHYLELTPIAIVRNPEGKIIAFSSMMPMYDNDQTLSIDLMRYISEAPSGTMDFMFVNLLSWAKDRQYKRFNLGMAPLANVGLSKYSFLSEKIASQIFLHGHFLYHFQGLKQFKEKYAHTWEPKYLAYRRKASLPFTMLQVSILISKKRK